MPTGCDFQKIHIIEILQEMLLIEVLGFPNGFDEEVGIYEISLMGMVCWLLQLRFSLVHSVPILDLDLG